MKDNWNSGDHYEKFMGRWSRLAAHQFLGWLAPDPGLKWLDVGCGSGTLTKVVLQQHGLAEVTAIDQSEGFVQTAQQRLGDNAHCMVGSALDLPLDDACIDITISGLLLNFLPEPDNALTEMKRVTQH